MRSTRGDERCAKSAKVCNSNGYAPMTPRSDAIESLHLLWEPVRPGSGNRQCLRGLREGLASRHWLYLDRMRTVSSSCALESRTT